MELLAVRRKQERGAVLSMLYGNDTAPLSIKTLELALLSSYPHISGDIIPVINYLRDKGYINYDPGEETSIVPHRSAMVCIAAKGTDLIEETIADDPGVVFGDAKRA